MKIFLDDLKKESWLVQKLQNTPNGWGKDLLNLKKPNYFIFSYNLVEAESQITLVSWQTLVQITELVYRGLKGEHLAWMQEPFDSNNYLFFSLLMFAMDTEEDKQKLVDLFISYKAKDIEENKRNLKQNLKGSFDINSRISFSDALYKIFGYNTKPVQGLIMVYDLIENYVQNTYDKSLYDNYLFRIVKAVKNPNQGLLPEYPDSSMRYLIVGEKALKNDPALEFAKKLFREGNAPYEIYLETGWYFNKEDFKWRKRISDDTFHITDAVTTSDKGTFYLPKGLTFEEYSKMIKDFSEGNSDIGRLIGQGYKGKLGDYISFEEAFKLYPELKNLYSLFAINFEKIRQNYYTYHFNDSIPKSLNLINNRKNQTWEEKVKYIALHEIQHYVQDFEDFGSGGNQYLANLIDGVGGESVKEFVISLSVLQKRFRDVASLISIEKYRKLIIDLKNITYKNFELRYQDRLIQVKDYYNSLLETIENITQSIEVVNNSANTFSINLVVIYSMVEETNNTIRQFVEENIGGEYLEIFAEALKKNREALNKENKLREKGFTLKDLYILNFVTYESLMGEIEARYTQQTTKIPKGLEDYFGLYTSEKPDAKRISVINNTIFDQFKSEAALETTADKRYIIHLPSSINNSINLLHETAHILYDFMRESVDADENSFLKMIEHGYDSLEEYFCYCFVDYVHRKNLDAGLQEDLSRERQIKNLDTFDNLFESCFYTKKEIDENGLILRFGFLNKLIDIID
jgi:hypothetical protein